MSQTFQTIDTEYSADAVEWCMIPGFERTLICGTYQLSTGEGEDAGPAVQPSSDNVRIGRLLQYELSEDMTLVEVNRVEVPAILDVKWHPQMIDDNAVLATASAEGSTRIYKCHQDSPLEEIAHASSDDNDTLALSLDWSKDVESRKLCVSNTEGYVSVFALLESGLQPVHEWQAHGSPYLPKAECWICAFDCHQQDMIYTGGEESALKGWDLRIGTSIPVFSNKQHEQGVCSIQSHPTREHCFISGSYDDTVRLWDTRSMKTSVVDCNVGGGVWRLKWHPEHRDKFLAACIYNGFFVMEADEQFTDLKPLYHYEEHNSLAYGADWCRYKPRGLKEQDSLIATCSFYDHALRLWSWNG